MKRHIIKIGASAKQHEYLRTLSTAERAERLRRYAEGRQSQQVYRIVITCDDHTMRVIRQVSIHERGNAFDVKEE